MPRRPYQLRTCVAKEDYEDTTIYFYTHDIFVQTNVSRQAPITWPFNNENSEKAAREIFVNFFPLMIRVKVPDQELSCELSYQVEASSEVAEVITIYTVTKEGNPISTRIQMRDKDGNEISNEKLLEQMEEWFELNVLAKLLH